MFLANYCDGLSDLPLDRQLREFSRSDCAREFRRRVELQSFHAVRLGCERARHPHGRDPRPGDADQRRLLRLRREIFDYIQEGDELVEQPFQRLIAERKLQRLPMGRILALHGYVQGQDHVRPYGGAGRLPVDGVAETGSPHPRCREIAPPPTSCIAGTYS